MKPLSRIESEIYNEGERLIPGRTHDYNEVRRHYGSYLFFREVIRADIERRGTASGPLTIVDLGCGVGHGCATLADLPNVAITGVDISGTSLEWAERHYARPNITWHRRAIPEFVASMTEYDYVVSRGVIEHVADGICVVAGSRWKSRLMFDVPFNEPAGRNPHHLLSNITEASFSMLPAHELFFENMQGSIYPAQRRPPDSNMILCACSAPKDPPICEFLRLPFEPDWNTLGPEANPPLQQANPPAAPPRAGVLERLRRRLLG